MATETEQNEPMTSQGTTGTAATATATATPTAAQSHADAHRAPAHKPAMKRPWNHTVAGVGFTISAVVQIAALALIFVLSVVDTWVFVRQANPDDPRDHIDALSPYHVLEQMTRRTGATPLFLLAFLFLLILLMAVHRLGEMRHFSHRALFWFVLGGAAALSVLWVVSRNMYDYSYPDTKSLSDAATAILTGHTNHFSDAYCQAHANDAAGLAAGSTAASTAAAAGADGMVDPSSSADAIRENMCLESPWLQDYFALYPFQSGPMLWFLLVYKIFGSGSILALQFVNALLGAGVCALVWKTGEAMHLSDGGLTVLAVLLVGCVPWHMHAMYAYTDIPGLFFVLLSVWITSKAVAPARPRERVDRLAGTPAQTRPWWQSLLLCALSFAVAGFGMTVKSTFVIVVLAQILALVVAAFATRRWWLAAAGLVGGLLARGLSGLARPLVSRMTGLTLGKGLPTLSWIDIGLHRGEVGLAGWWSPRAINFFQKAGHDPDRASRLVRESVHARLAQFSSAPAGAARFFREKLSTEWADPTFESMYHSESGFSHATDGFSRTVLTGKLHPLVFGYENAFQSLVYLFALVGVVMLVRAQWKRLHADALFLECMLSAAFVGGFLCYVVWEAKSTYTLPFAMLLLPFAAQGLQGLCEACHRALEARKK